MTRGWRFIICNRHQVLLLDDQIKEGEMGRACSAHGRDKFISET